MKASWPWQIPDDTLAAQINRFGSAKACTAILADEGDAEVNFSFGTPTRPSLIYTADPIEIGVDCTLVVKLENPVLFHDNVMKGRSSYSIDELKGSIEGELQNAVGGCTRAKMIKELNTDLSLKREFEQEIEAHLNRTFQRNGLAFVQLRTLNYRHGEAYLEISRREAELSEKRMLAEVDNDEQLQELAEKEREVEIFKKRAVVWDDFEKATQRAEINKLRTASELDTLKQEIDKENLLRDEDMAELKTTLAEKQDAREARAHILEKCRRERAFDLKRAELTQQPQLTSEQLDFELETERKTLEGKQQIELERIRFEMDKQEQTASFGRAQKQADDAARREAEIGDAQNVLQIRLSKAKTEAEIGAIEREQDQLDAEMGLAI